MFKQLLLKLMFKAVLALGTMLGLASFAVYLSGGSPGAIWSKVGGGAVASMGDSASRLGGQISGLADSARRTSGDTFAAFGDAEDDSANAGNTQLWTWQDASGVTHYSNTPPAGQNATTMFVDPNANVVAPVSAPPSRRRSSDRDQSGSTTRTSASGNGSGASGTEALPGIAGAFQQTPGGSGGVDPEQAKALLKLLQGGAPR